MRGDRLRRLREREDLSQTQLAEMVDIGEAQILRYEKEIIIPRSDVVIKLARFFNVSTDYLLGHSDSPDPYVSELSEQEVFIIEALRRGQPYEAIKAIINTDEKAHNGA